LAPSFQVPDLMVFRRIDHDEMVLRIQARNRPGEIDATMDFFEHIRVSFDHMIHAWRRSPVLVLEPAVDLSDPAVADQVVGTIGAMLNGDGGPSRPDRRR
jgi:deoxyadenosine/deoxycytidine kinase